ncbi:MAG: hypothetical protein K0R59_3968, partial [Sphingobacterium sp.]|nr:hypothetical protein [Sphingobacterium sp.]MDF2518672.1 hypothetical protein [Sphingobacterium sp.]
MAEETENDNNLVPANDRIIP